jgi:hypothetical protein
MTALCRSQMQGSSKTIRKVKQHQAGNNKAGVEAGTSTAGVKAEVGRKGNNKLCKVYMPRLDDAPFGYTGRAQISWNVLATIGSTMH